MLKGSPGGGGGLGLTGGGEKDEGGDVSAGGEDAVGEAFAVAAGVRVATGVALGVAVGVVVVLGVAVAAGVVSGSAALFCAVTVPIKATMMQRSVLFILFLCVRNDFSDKVCCIWHFRVRPSFQSPSCRRSCQGPSRLPKI